MSPRSLRPFYVVVLSFVAISPWVGVSGQEPATAIRSQRIFICGHSFHMPVAAPLQEMAKAAGITDQQIVGSQGIGGSQVVQHWNLADDQNKVKKALRAGQVDVLTLAPNFQIPDEGIDRFTALGLEHNPKIRILVQASWPAFDLVAERGQFKNEQRDQTNPATLRKNYDLYYQRLVDQVQGLNDQFKDKQKRPVVYLVPVGHAVLALREKVAEGKAAGVAKQSDLFRDPIGHGKGPVIALAAYCHYAVIYGRSPVGLPVPSVLKGQVPEAEAEKLTHLLQEIAWETVQRQPLTGVTK